MTIFWILVAGLAGLAALFVVAPLLQPQATTTGTDDDPDDIDQDQVNLALFKQQLAELETDLVAGKLDQSQYSAAKADLEREVLRNVGSPTPGSFVAVLPGPKVTGLALSILVPGLALLLYLGIGERDIIPRLAESAGGQSAPGHGAGGDGMPPLDVLVERLEARMAEAPDDAEGWLMLGRTYFAMRDPQKAEGAFEKAYALTPDDPQLLLAYAESLAANNGNSLEGRPSELIAQVLEQDPENPTARWLTGMAAFQRGQFNAATVAWNKVLSVIDPASEEATELRELIAEAQQRAGLPADMRLAENAAAELPVPATEERADDAGTQAGAEVTGDAAPPDGQSADGTAAQSAPEPAAEASAGASVQVSVSLSPGLAARAAPDTTVFVYAKAAAGPPMPLAVQRVTVADLPVTLRLDDSMAMMPAMKLSSFPEVIVGARVSPSGQAMAQPGDLEGESGPIPSTAGDSVAVVIDSVRP
ncbi:MAG: c-type cytochrome biogenesis protein CcmI [Thiohalocapsa sp.]|nr:c-type cytochrome biogenesis protein CcmI [Thiohalocapsa sp.]